MPPARSLTIRELAEYAKSSGSVNLAQGVIDVPPPEILMAILKKLPLKDLSRYENRRGVLVYRQAIQRMLAARNWEIPVESIMATAGGMAGIAASLLVACPAGGRVLLPEPFFQGHRNLIDALGLQAVYVSVPIDQAPDWDELISHFPEVDAAIITTPANPTGQIATIPDLKKILAAGQRHDCFIVLDEIYRDFIWNEPIPDDAVYSDLDLSRASIVRSFSKTLSVSGWRIGYLLSSPALIEAIINRHDPLFGGASTIAQNTLAVGLTDHYQTITRYIHELRELCQANLAVLADAFSAYGMVPTIPPAAYYMLMKHNRASDIAAMEELIERQIVTLPGRAIYSHPDINTDYIRIQVGITAENRQRVIDQLS